MGNGNEVLVAIRILDYCHCVYPDLNEIMTTRLAMAMHLDKVYPY